MLRLLKTTTALQFKFALTTLCLGLFLVLPSGPVFAQSPYLVKDINPSADAGSSNPTLFTQVGGATYFFANVPAGGYQLWKTDGTPSGTSLVTNQFFPAASNMTSSNGRLYFLVGPAMTAVIGSGPASSGPNTATGQLWVSDGTADGTRMLRQPVGTSIADVNGTLFFASDDGSGGSALWKSDGTAEGTVIVKTLPPPTTGLPVVIISPPIYPPIQATISATSLTAVGGTLFFTIGGSGTGTLWKSDGTEAGTVVVQSTANFVPQNLISFDGQLFFTSTDVNAGSGIALWKSDGTQAGTIEIAGIGSGTVNPQEFAVVDSTLFFTLVGFGDQNTTTLWKSDGTAAGTGQVVTLCSSSCTTSPSYLTNFNGSLFYVAQDSLWKTDGTAEGTLQISTAISPSDLAVLNGKLYFEATDSVNGRELWQSDGTANGTALLEDVCPGVCSGLQPPRNIATAPYLISGDFSTGTSFLNGLIVPFLMPTPPRALIPSNGKLFFMGCEPVNQCEPWTSDGTSSGTTILKNVVLNTASQITAAVDLNGTLLFPAYDGTAAKLWKTDGTLSGTQPIKNVAVRPLSPLFAVMSNFVLFAGSDGSTGYELWKSDGTDAGTVLVKDINTGSVNSLPASSSPSYLTNVNGVALFAANDGIHGNELWKSDGTPNGTVMVKDINPGSANSSPQYLTNVNGTLFFVALDEAGYYGLWKSDGTESGTVMLREFTSSTLNCLGDPTACAFALAPRNLIRAGNTLFFSTSDGLWKSDGTPAGTVQVLPGALLPVQNLVDVNGTLFFWNAMSLWKSDGTDSGTVVVKNFTPAGNFPPGSILLTTPSSSGMANVNGTLFFVQNGALWKSDGTTDGTVQVKDVPASALFNVNGTLYFAGRDANGTELWKSDGTDAGTLMMSDINPGPAGSVPAPLAISHGRFFFNANDGPHGTELWALGVAPTSVAVTSSKPVAVVGASVPFTATVSSSITGTPSGTVTFMDGSDVLGTATLNANASATFTTTALSVGTHSITAVYGGDSNYVATTSDTLSEVVLATAPNYSISANPTSATITAGQTATFVISATADQYFNGTITFGCGTLPAGVSCAFSPASINPTSATPAQTMLTVSTTSQRAALTAPAASSHSHGAVFFAFMIGGSAFGCILLGGKAASRRIAMVLAVLAMIVLGLSSCGGGGSSRNPNGTPAGPMTVQVTATATAGTNSGNTTPHPLTITINVQ